MRLCRGYQWSRRYDPFQTDVKCRYQAVHCHAPAKVSERETHSDDWPVHVRRQHSSLSELGHSDDVLEEGVGVRKVVEPYDGRVCDESVAPSHAGKSICLSGALQNKQHSRIDRHQRLQVQPSFHHFTLSLVEAY